MTATRAEITIHRSPSDVWDVVGDPHSIIDWVPGVESCEIVGDRRTAVLRGNELTETFHVDHAERRVTYSILGAVTSHQGSVQVIATGRALIASASARSITPRRAATPSAASRPTVHP